MDRGRQMSQWKNNFAPSLLIFTLLILQCQFLVGQDLKCTEDEHEHSTKPFCCNKCPPGFRMAQECQSARERTKCEKCERGTYQDTSNYYRLCYKCYTCKDNEEEVKECNYLSNRVCRCKPGYFKYPIFSNSHECRRCKVCGDGETVERDCTPYNDTVCKPRDSCFDKCSQSCGYTTKAPRPMSTHPPRVLKEAPYWLIAAGSVGVLVLALVAMVAIVSCKAMQLRWTQKKATLPSQKTDDLTSESVTSTETFSLRVDSSSDDNESVPSPTYARMEKQNALPHCMKREINTNQFIYSVLEEVPVGRVMELVRRLGVKDQSIDRARRDNPQSCLEAQYQMLKVWSDGGSRGGSGSTLSWALLQTLLDTLLDMGLTGCAETLEEQYDLEHLQFK
ncbi:hypothetical protein ACEWY4_020297 [Coilia grayii]|uniref:Uncharacterized protein n=1 Tax=Coilia grayii TaxID=363190 RepID=A0ABD1JCI2_9TELE